MLKLAVSNSRASPLNTENTYLKVNSSFAAFDVVRAEIGEAAPQSVSEVRGLEEGKLVEALVVPRADVGRTQNQHQRCEFSFSLASQQRTTKINGSGISLP